MPFLDKERLYRALPNRLDYWQEGNPPSPSSAAFKDNCGKGGVSVNRDWGKGDAEQDSIITTLHKIFHHPPKTLQAVAYLTYKDCIECDAHVEHSHNDRNPGHSEIFNDSSLTEPPSNIKAAKLLRKAVIIHLQK